MENSDTVPSKDGARYPETAKFMAWYDSEKAKGLRDIKFCLQNTDQATPEAVFAEVNRAIESKDEIDPNFF